MIRRSLLLTALAAPLALSALPAFSQTAAPAAAPATTPQRVRGTVKSLTGNTLVVDTREGGTATITLAPNYTVAAVVPATLADAKAGTFIGTAAVGPKDKLRALEVLIFPEAMRGSGEGHYPWDLMPESTMTNATIESEVTGTDGRELTVVAKGEKLKVMVPAERAHRHLPARRRQHADPRRQGVHRGTEGGRRHVDGRTGERREGRADAADVAYGKAARISARPRRVVPSGAAFASSSQAASASRQRGHSASVMLNIAESRRRPFST